MRAIPFLIILLIFSAFITFHGLDKHSVWGDEKISISCAIGISRNDTLEQNKQFSNHDIEKKNTIINVVRATTDDNGNAFFYNFTLHFWLKFFGVSDFSARGMSVFFNMLSIVVLYIFALRYTSNDKIALIAVLCFVLNPLMIGISQLSRSYSLVVFLSLLSTTLLMEIINKGRKGYLLYLLYGIVTGLSLITHYLTTYIFLIHAFLVLKFVYKTRDFRLLLAGVPALGLPLFWLWVGGLEGYKVMHQQDMDVLRLINNNPKAAQEVFVTITPQNLVVHFLRAFNAMFGNYYLGLSKDVITHKWLVVLPFLYPIFLFVLVFITIRKTGEGVLRGTLNFIKKYYIVILLSFSFLSFATYLAAISGHAFSFTILYSSFVMPSSAVLLAIIYYKVFSPLKTIGIRILFVITLLLVGFYSFINISKVYIGLGYRETDKERIKNPYQSLANSISRNYKQGDIIQYPTSADAFLTNLYLPDSLTIVQKVNTTSATVGIIRPQKYIELANLNEVRY